MSSCVYTETIDTHLDKAGIAFHEVLRNRRVLCVQIDAVACNLSPPARRVVPVEPSFVVPVVMRVAVCEVRVLHHCQACAVLIGGLHIGIVCRKHSSLFGRYGYHRCIDIAQILRVVLLEHLAQVVLAEVAGVLKHNVKYEFHPTFVYLVYKFLKSNVCICIGAFLGHISVVYLREVHGMVAVIVESRSVFDNRSNPHCRESESLDVVELVDKSLEISTPFRVIDVLYSVPTIDVVVPVSVIKAGCHREIDCLIAEVGTVTDECPIRHCLLCGTE